MEEDAGRPGMSKYLWWWWRELVPQPVMLLQPLSWLSLLGRRKIAEEKIMGKRNCC
jgi:hypothetical protein